MSDPLIISAVKWWFRLFTAGSISMLLGVLVFIRTGINSGMMPQSAYVYAGIIGVLTFLALVWVRGKIYSAPEMIESFLRRTGLYKD